MYLFKQRHAGYRCKATKALIAHFFRRINIRSESEVQKWRRLGQVFTIILQDHSNQTACHSTSDT